MPIVSTTKMTADQFLLIGEDPPGIRLELVNGEVAVSPSPTPEHSHIDTELRALLHQHVKANALGKVFGDVDTHFGEHDVRRPDIAYFTSDRLHLVGKKFIEGPPDLCVEILSPSTSTIDRVDKFQQYESAGVLNYWIIDPEPRTIEAFSLRRGKYVSVGRAQGTGRVKLPPFPNLEIVLDDLWFVPPARSRRKQR